VEATHDGWVAVRSRDRSDERHVLRRPIVVHGRRPSVSVVIPAKDEGENLGFILPLLPPMVDEVILVDGRSTDATLAVARDQRPDVRVVHQERKGKGDAMCRGFDAASGDIIVMLDADGSADPAEIPRFVAALERGAQFAKGSRYLPGAGSQDITRFRGIGNAALTGLVNLLFGTRYTDLCYGYNAFRAECLPFLDVDCAGFEVETLINVRLAKAGLRVTEVPSYEHARIAGRSNLKAFRDGWRVLRTILRERVTPRRRVPLREVPPRSRRPDLFENGSPPERLAG
jgi:glycosyltransferase involved in cell wall biosynthesis